MPLIKIESEALRKERCLSVASSFFLALDSIFQAFFPKRRLFLFLFSAVGKKKESFSAAGKKKKKHIGRKSSEKKTGNAKDKQSNYNINFVY